MNPFAPRKSLPEKAEQIKAWTRELHRLDDTVVVAVTELTCREPGCPDIETVVGIMRPGVPIEALRIHKAISEVMREDLLPSTKLEKSPEENVRFRS